MFYRFIYLLKSNNVDRYKGNVVEHGLCFMSLLQCFTFKHFDNWRTIGKQGLCFMFMYNFLYILYIHTYTFFYQTILTTEQLSMDKVYVLYVYIYLLISNIVDRYKGNIVEQGLCFMCLLHCFSFRHFDNWRTIDEQGLCFMFVYTFLYHTILIANQGTVFEHLIMNKFYILYYPTYTFVYQTILTTE